MEHFSWICRSLIFFPQDMEFNPEYRLHLYQYGKRKTLTAQCRNLTVRTKTTWPSDLTMSWEASPGTWGMRKSRASLSPHNHISTLTVRKQTTSNWQAYYRIDKDSSKCGKFKKRKKTQTGAHKKQWLNTIQYVRQNPITAKGQRKLEEEIWRYLNVS